MKDVRERELFAQVLAKARDKRLEQLEDVFGSTEEFEVCNRQVTLFTERLKQAIPEEVREDLISLSDAWNDLLVLNENFFYARGFQDAVKLVRIFIGHGE